MTSKNLNISFLLEAETETETEDDDITVPQTHGSYVPVEPPVAAPTRVSPVAAPTVSPPPTIAKDGYEVVASLKYDGYEIVEQDDRTTQSSTTSSTSGKKNSK